MEELIIGLVPEIISQEEIQDGTSKNFRVLRERFYAETMIIDRVTTYKHSVNSHSWTVVKDIKFEEADVKEEESFKLWNISDHPTNPNLKRKAFLTQLVVNKKQVKVRLTIKHYNIDGTDALYEDLTLNKIGTDDVIMTRPDGTQVGERTYWDELTNAGYTPYQLLDSRIPELDAAGKLNEY